jgi:undecaprenyl-diphosphatase
MDTFQSVVFSILYTVSQLLPLSFEANAKLLELLTEWSPPESLHLHAMALGVFLAMLFHFRHDWVSIVASFFRTLISFRRPTSLDDYLFWFLILGTAPALILRDLVRDLGPPPVWAYAVGLVVLSFWLWFGEKWTRNKKSMLGWGFLDAFLLGLFNILAILPGGNFVLSAMGIARARHFQSR